MGDTVRTTRADVEFVLGAAELAGQQYRAGNHDAARNTLRYAKAETRELGDVVDAVANAAALDID